MFPYVKRFRKPLISPFSIIRVLESHLHQLSVTRKCMLTTLIQRFICIKFFHEYKKAPHPKKGRGTVVPPLLAEKQLTLAISSKSASYSSRITMRLDRQSLLQLRFGLEAQKPIHLPKSHWFTPTTSSLICSHRLLSSSTLSFV